MEQTRSEIRALLGKQVVVVLDRGGYPDPLSPAVVVTGKLLGFGEAGDFEIEEDDGFIHYCWPALRVVAVDTGEPDLVQLHTADWEGMYVRSDEAE